MRLKTADVRMTLSVTTPSSGSVNVSSNAPEAASIIAAETGLAVYELDPAVTGSPESDAYIKAMDQNTEVLEKAFSEGGLKK